MKRLNSVKINLQIPFPSTRIPFPIPGRVRSVQSEFSFSAGPCSCSKYTRKKKKKWEEKENQEVECQSEESLNWEPGDLGPLPLQVTLDRWSYLGLHFPIPKIRRFKWVISRDPSLSRI